MIPPGSRDRDAVLPDGSQYGQQDGAGRSPSHRTQIAVGRTARPPSTRSGTARSGWSFAAKRVLRAGREERPILCEDGWVVFAGHYRRLSGETEILHSPSPHVLALLKRFAQRLPAVLLPQSAPTRIQQNPPPPHPPGQRWVSPRGGSSRPAARTERDGGRRSGVPPGAARLPAARRCHARLRAAAQPGRGLPHLLGRRRAGCGPGLGVGREGRLWEPRSDRLSVPPQRCTSPWCSPRSAACWLSSAAPSAWRRWVGSELLPRARPSRALSELLNFCPFSFENAGKKR